MMQFILKVFLNFADVMLSSAFLALYKLAVTKHGSVSIRNSVVSLIGNE